MKTGLVLVNFHNETETLGIAKQFAEYDFISDIVIVDNEATKKSRKVLNTGASKVKYICSDHNTGYSRANNAGIRYLESKGCEAYIISNSDIEITEDTVKELIDKLEASPEYGMLAPVLRDNYGKAIELRTVPLNYKRLFLRLLPGLDKDSFERLGINNGITDQSMVSGSFFIARAVAMKASGYFDSNVFLYREEEILGKRMEKAGYKVGVVRDLHFIHLHDYAGTGARAYYNQLRRESFSERYYFKRYMGANKCQMVYVTLMQMLFTLVVIGRNERHKIKEKLSNRCKNCCNECSVDCKCGAAKDC